MAQELAEFKAESTELKNQDLTIRRLEERNRNLEAQLEDKVLVLLRLKRIPRPLWASVFLSGMCLFFNTR